MGVSLLAYVVTFFIFCINYVFTLCAVIFPKWLTFVTPVPFYMETNYGLFKLCRRPFPSSEHGDCQEDGFCELWRAAAAGMVIATILGGLTLFGILATMCSERRKRSQAWAPLSFMFLIYAIPQAFSMGIIAYLFNTSATFYMGTRYNFSFVLTIISWCLAVILAVILSLVGIMSPPDYSYQRI